MADFISPNDAWLMQLTLTDLNTLFVYYNKLKPVANTAPNSQRFGQWICNDYCPTNSTWPELYYEPNDRKAFNMIVQKLLEQEGLKYL